MSISKLLDSHVLVGIGVSKMVELLTTTKRLSQYFFAAKALAAQVIAT